MSKDDRLAHAAKPVQKLSTSVEALGAPLADFLFDARLPTTDVFDMGDSSNESADSGAQTLDIQLGAAELSEGGILSLGQIEIGPEIGFGGFGRVFKARYPGDIEWPLAIKVFDPSSFQDPKSALERFQRESLLLRNLRHRYITQFYFAGTYNGRPFLLMEHFDGENLAKLPKDGIDSRMALDLISMFAEGLSHAHSFDIVHRDIKPQNLMVRAIESGFDVRVLDFGIASELNAKRLTRIGHTVVGDSFSAPEMDDLGGEVDQRADIYSLGSVWFYLLYGRAPKGLTVNSFIDQNTPPDHWVVIRRCLRSDPGLRYQTMDDLRDDLERLAGRRGISKQVPQAFSLPKWHSVVYLIDVMYHCASTATATKRRNVEHSLQSEWPLGKSDLVFAYNYLLDNGFMEEVFTQYEDGSGEDLIRATPEGRKWAYQHNHLIPGRHNDYEGKDEGKDEEKDEDIHY